MPSWRCVKMCGACCFLNPQEREDLEDYLTSEQLSHYLSLVGSDGWCINFDHSKRECKIYQDRPRFCRVEPETFWEMFEVESDEFNQFAIDCCHEQIESVYGPDTDEMKHYVSEVGW